MEGAVFSNEEGGCVLPGEGAEAAKGGEVAKIDGGDIELVRAADEKKEVEL